MFKKSLLFLSLLVLFTSCIKKTNNVEHSSTTDTLQLKYAKGFAIRYFKNYKEVLVYNPWQKGNVFARYYLINKPDIKTPVDGIRVTIPLQSLAATSVTHFEFLKLIDALKTVNAVCSPRIIYNKEINAGISSAKIADLGDAFNINVEKTLQLAPNAVMMSGYNQNDPYAQRIIKAGIPVIFNNEWMENSLLARAEWIKFVAAFYGKEVLADSLFESVDRRYNEIKVRAMNVKNKPKVMTGSNFRGTWYMPSGQNFMAKLIEDAGGSYFYAYDTNTGSLALNVETVLKNFSQSDIWINCNFGSLKDLINADSKNKLFRPVVLNEVYNFNKRMMPGSANDFWESAIAHPDIILSDVIAIFHPELLPGYELVYADKLK